MTTLVASFTPGSARSNFGGVVGLQFSPTGSNITVTSIGARMPASYKGGLALYIVSGGTVLLASGVCFIGGSSGTFYYTPVSPITLTVGTTYQLFAQVLNSGQSWPDSGAITLNGAGSAIGAFASTPTGSVSTGTANQMFFGVDLNGTTNTPTSSSFTILNPNDILYGSILDGNYLFQSTFSAPGGARAVDAKTTGLFYFEVINNSSAVTDLGYGVSMGGTLLSAVAANATNGVIFFNNAVWRNGSNLSINPGAITIGTVIGIAVDITNGYIWFTVDGTHWNSTSVANTPTANNTGGGGIALTGLRGLYPTVTSQSLSPTPAAFNFGQASFVYTVPTGFTSGWTVTAPTGTAEISQTVREILLEPTPGAQISQVVREALTNPNPNAQISQVVREVLLEDLTGNYTGSFSDTIATSDSLGNTVVGATSDSIASSDSYGFSITLTARFSDSVATSDSYRGVLSPLSASFSDTVATSDSYGASFLLSFSDTIATSDSYAAVPAGTPEHLFDGLVREALGSGGTTVTVRFQGLDRESLVSAGSSSDVKINFSGVLREVLVGTNALFTNILPVAAIPGITLEDIFGPIPIFPALPEGFPVKVSLVVDTTIGTVKSLREMRVAQQQYPIWDIEILFEELRDQTQNQSPFSAFAGYVQYMELVQLWLMMYGQTGVFAFDCPWDDSRTEQLIGVGDGSTYIFTAYRTWGTGANATIAPVGVINAVTDVKVNGATVATSNYYTMRDKIYFIDKQGQAIPPPLGQDITMTFSYYYLCRFTEDEQDFEEFSKDRWTVPSLKFRAVIWQ